ncbi:MAG TPA: AI-2E family transporter [Anaeromyxobacteraceae bacterium]|nr:AI-2E family transporter [Anaeromyxobacteraceae bacterium]
MVTSRTAHAALVVLAVMAVALLIRIAAPFATAFFLAAVLAGALSRPTSRLATAFGGRRRVAALLITVTVLLAVLGPLFSMGAVLVPQIENGLSWLRGALKDDTLRALVMRAPESLQPMAEHLRLAIPSSLDRLQELATAQGARAASVLADVLSATGSFLLQSAVTVVALFFLLVDGPDLVDWLNEAIPLKRGQVSELLREFRRVSVTVLLSTLATGGVQSVLAVVGYAIAGVPNLAFFGLVTFVLSLVPALGATVVVLAVGVVKLTTGHAAAGVFLLIWGLGVVSLIDNVVKPMFIRGGVPIHGAIIFFALLGGLAVFGPVGFLVGPLAVSFLVAVVRMYKRDYGA